MTSEFQVQSDSDSDENQECMNDYFPNEILEEILRNVPSQTDLCQARLVCQRWRIIIDEAIGHSIIVTSFSNLAHFLPRDEAHKVFPIDLRIIKSLNLHRLAVRKLTIGSPGLLVNEAVPNIISVLNKDLEALPMLSFPHVLQSLSCFEPLCPIFLSSLPSLIKLSHLNVSLFSLSSLNLQKSFKLKQVLYSLTSLVISKTLTHPEFNSCSSIPQLNQFLSSLETPKLSSFEICYPVLSLLDADEDSTRQIMKFLRKTSKTIRNLSIYVFSPSQNFLPPSKQFYYVGELLDEMKDLGSILRLNNFELKDNHLHSLRPSFQIKSWISFLTEQKSLTSLKLLLKSSLEFEDLIAVLLKNSKTLASIEVSFFPSQICKETRDIYFVPIDCRFLAKCHAIERLIVSDKLTNTKYLPHCLKYVYIDAMLTNEDAHNLLCPGKENFERIELKDTRGGTPKGFGYGVQLETLLEFVKWRKIKRLILYAGCTDGKFPSKGIANGDIQDLKFLRKRKAQESRAALLNLSSNMMSFTEYEHLLLDCIRIDWKLNKHGFYEVNKDVYQNEGENKNCEQIDSKMQFEIAQNCTQRESEIQHQHFKCANLCRSFQ